MTAATKQMLDKALEDVKNAKTPEERKRAAMRVKGIQATVKAYTFNKEEMDRLT